MVAKPCPFRVGSWLFVTEMFILTMFRASLPIPTLFTCQLSFGLIAFFKSTLFFHCCVPYWHRLYHPVRKHSNSSALRNIFSAHRDERKLGFGLKTFNGTYPCNMKFCANDWAKCHWERNSCKIAQPKNARKVSLPKENYLNSNLV